VKRAILSIVAVGALAAPTAASASPAIDSIVGVEFPSANISTTGNFAGIATGQIPGLWTATVMHQPLSNTTVPVTGGTFTLKAVTGTTIGGAIEGGSVTPSSPSTGCGNETFTISVTMNIGSFSGVLTHYRTSFFGTCLTYSASITGTATFG
jgi:hypothetical protein